MSGELRVLRVEPETRVHVTEAIKASDLMPSYSSKEAADRGTYVHLICQYDDEGTLDEVRQGTDLRKCRIRVRCLDAARLFPQGR